MALVQRKRREFAFLALVLTAAFYAVRLIGAFRGLPPGGQLVARVTLESYFGMAWILTLVGYSRQWLNRDSPALRYATEAVYPFYIAHQTVIIAIGFCIAGWAAPISVKLPLMAAGAFLGSWVIFEISRRIPVARLVMGMRWHRRARVQSAL